MTPAIKICGLSTAETVTAAVEGGATHVGFIFFARSPRNVAVETAGELARLAGWQAKAVAVTVDADDKALDRIVAVMKPDMLQLHGGESPERVAAVRARYGLPVMKALSIRAAGDLGQTDAYRGVADSFLFDAAAPKGSVLPGGNGVAFDWSLLAALDGTIDYMLSGGLSRGNVALALSQTKAHGIDVSSGVESAPGVKDVGLIQAFLKTVRAAAAAAPDDAEPERRRSFP